MATVNKNLSVYDKTVFQKRKFSFWVVVAEWNEAITEGLYNGAEQAFLENKVPLNILYDGMFLEVWTNCLWMQKNASNSKRRCCNSYRLWFKGKPNILILYVKVLLKE
jgi:hypothetical protein